MQALGDGEGQGSLGCCSPWGCKELDMTEWQGSNKCSIVATKNCKDILHMELGFSNSKSLCLLITQH